MRRADHFLAQQLAPADRVARNALRLNVTDQKILAKLSNHSRKTDDLRRVLEELHVTSHNLSRSRAPTKRAGRSSAKTTTMGG